VPLKPAQIGKCGELLVQYHLLLHGVESAPLTTDSGIDLVAYSPRKAEPLTVQVNTNLKPKPGGGAGSDALDWWVDQETPVDFVALVDLSAVRVWFFSMKELSALAQQKSNGRYHLYMYVDPTAKPRKLGRAVHVYEFEKYLLANRAHAIFGK
jgi:hypothetical protein